MSNTVSNPEKLETESIQPNDEEVRLTTEAFIHARMKFIEENPFYGVLLLNVDPVATGGEVPIAAVNYKNLFLNAVDRKRSDNPVSFPFHELTKRGREVVLVHEISHLIFEHLSIPANFNRDICNIAMDAVINRIIDEDPKLSLDELPKGCVRPIRTYNGYTGFTIGEGPTQKQFNIEGFKDMDWIPIYWAIMEQLEKECKAAGGKQSRGKQSREELAKSIQQAAKKLADKNPMNGDIKEPEEGEGEGTPEFEQAKAKFRSKVIEAYETAKSQGLAPAGMERYIDVLTTAKVKWTDYLRQLIRTEISKSDFSHKANSRRAHIGFGTKKRPPIFPKVESETLSNVWLALDTSGSMSQDDITQGLSEFASLRQTLPFPLHFVSCDAAVYEVQSYDSTEEPDWTTLSIDGGGGTDFRPVFDLIAQYQKEKGIRPALLVFFTDTFGSFPEKEPDYPVIWVCNYRGGQVPWGTLINTAD